VGIVDRIRGPAVWTLDVTAASGNFIIHEDFVGITNDIALVRLVNSIPSHQYVSIVALPHRSDKNIDLVGKNVSGKRLKNRSRITDFLLGDNSRLRSNK
jgi:hypothetical protein